MTKSGRLTFRSLRIRRKKKGTPSVLRSVIWLTNLSFATIILEKPTKRDWRLRRFKLTNDQSRALRTRVNFRRIELCIFACLTKYIAMILYLRKLKRMVRYSIEMSNAKWNHFYLDHVTRLIASKTKLYFLHVWMSILPSSDIYKLRWVVSHTSSARDANWNHPHFNYTPTLITARTKFYISKRLIKYLATIINQ